MKEFNGNEVSGGCVKGPRNVRLQRGDEGDQGRGIGPRIGQQTFLPEKTAQQEAVSYLIPFGVGAIFNKLLQTGGLYTTFSNQHGA